MCPMILGARVVTLHVPPILGAHWGTLEFSQLKTCPSPWGTLGHTLKSLCAPGPVP
jgi:hypothetical protein